MKKLTASTQQQAETRDTEHLRGFLGHPLAAGPFWTSGTPIRPGESAPGTAPASRAAILAHNLEATPLPSDEPDNDPPRQHTGLRGPIYYR